MRRENEASVCRRHVRPVTSCGVKAGCRDVRTCEGATVVVHPGGHYVPVSKEWVVPLVGFIMKYGKDEEGKADGPSL